MSVNKGFLGLSNIPRVLHCPACGKTVGVDDPICPNCSADLPTTPPLAASEPNAGLAHMFRQKTDDGAPLNEAAEMDRYSSNAMWLGICSPCCWSIITGPLAIYYGVEALRLLSKYPEFERNDKCTMKAIIGLIFGGIFGLISILGLFLEITKIARQH